MTGNGMREPWDDTQQMAAGQTRNRGRCSEDKASAHWSQMCFKLLWWRNQHIVVMILHLVNKVGLNQIRFLALVRALDGDEEYVDAGLPSEPRRLLHLVCGPAVHQHHSHVGSSSTVTIGITEVLPVDVGQGLSCQGTRGRQGEGYKDATVH